jgi:phosphatidylserine decarboxylase
VTSDPTVVRYRDRATREIRTETVFAERALRWFYEDPIGARVFASLLNRPWFSRLYGLLQDLPSSREKIPAFARLHGIDTDEIDGALESFASFNAFFCRRLKPGARPFPDAPEVLASPADGKVLVFPQLAKRARLPVKGTRPELSGLLDSEAAARRFHGGQAIVIRLAPYDYHRFHFPDDGQADPARAVRGRYDSVSPIALAKVPDVYCRNKRMTTDFRSEHFGDVLLVEVGALTVGTIVQTYVPGAVRRGEEKGYFRFGGSTIVLLFAPNTLDFDPALVADSAQGLEVQVRAGDPIAIACSSRF